ncbi:MAG: hypothetical protein IPM63_07270 [Acidobacteriota bacterium]|nr:MAG: hypothetical protein IPM63_07270 [Acidobacteriota bacterium]
MRLLNPGLAYFSIAAVIFATAIMPAAAQSNGGYLLQGTYTIDRNASENSDAILENVSRRESPSAAERSDLAAKLEAPETISISVEGNRVSLETSLGGAPAVFTADGVARSSRRADGSTVSLKAEFTGDVLTVSSLGGESDYTLTFAPEDGGRSMRVTRRITTSYLSETVFADSIYRRSDGYDTTASTSGDFPTTENPDDDEGWSDSGDGVVFNPQPSTNDRDPVRRDPDQRRSPRTGTFAVPSGTILTGSLDGFVTTKSSIEGDPFRIRVESPAQYSGAVIEGYVSDIERTGKISGRSKITFNFESIVFADGRRYDFAGVLQKITDEDGDEIKINDEGEARSKSRTGETAKRSGIGAGLGAIIGGILGGGKGAIIGATIGAGAGAGSMIPGGRDDLEIGPEATLTIQSTSPGR